MSELLAVDEKAAATCRHERMDRALIILYVKRK